MRFDDKGNPVVTLEDLEPGGEWPEWAVKAKAKNQESRHVHLPVTERPTPTRNMLFYVWPCESESGLWKRTVRRLVNWIDQFDGIRSVAVASGDGLAPLVEVQQQFSSRRIDNWICQPNNPSLCEAAAFPALLETVKDADGITFYGHSKGVSRGCGDWAVQLWMEGCFEFALRRPQLVERQIVSEGCLFTGPFRKGGRVGPKESKSTWHYSGTFFWFDNKLVFARDWQRFEPHRWGVEAWPSLVAARGETGFLGVDESRDLYNWRAWPHQALGALQRFRDDDEAVAPGLPCSLPTIQMSRPILNIVTPVSRPENLPVIQRMLAKRFRAFEVRWHVVADANHVAGRPNGLDCHFYSSTDHRGHGEGQRNLALENIDSGWVWFLDDDNLPHVAFDGCLADAIVASPDASGFVFGQFDGGSRVLRHAAPENVAHTKLDMAQFVLRREIIGEVRFPVGVYASDWALFSAIWANHKEGIRFGPACVHYNALRR